MVTALNILLSYLTCTDPVMVNKWNNILASFWHKDDGQVITEISTTQTEFTVKTKASDGTVTTNTVSLYQEPEQFPISKITDLQSILDAKVDEVVGKGLSEEDFTTALKEKLETLQNYVHPDSHTIGEVDGLQDIIDDIQASLNTINDILTTLPTNQYRLWNGYRLFKIAGNSELFPQTGEEVQGRGDGRYKGGEWVHFEAKRDLPDAQAPDDILDMNLFTSYP